MIVYIARHGKATRDSPSGADRDRRLRGRGRRQAEYLAEQLASMAVAPAAVLTSPYLRTVETADIIADALGLTPAVDERLLCGAPASAALHLIAECDSLGVTPLLIGHNPQVSELVGVLARGVAGVDICVRTGELFALSGDDPALVGRLSIDRRLRLEDE
jgi:phosphohistidine phosphatase